MENRKIKLRDKKYIESTEYEEWMMTKRLSDGEEINGAQRMSPNFRFRLFEENGLGAWRHWGSYENRELIAKFAYNPELKGIDFGGGRGPISPHADIVDPYFREKYGLMSKYPTLDFYEDETIDYIWSSHTLEHVLHPMSIVKEMRRVLKKGGTLLLLLPAYTCRRWWPGLCTTHKHIFCLGFDFERAISIDFLLEKLGFSIIKAYYCGDMSIFIHAEK